MAQSPPPSLALFAIVVVIVLAAAGLGGYFLYRQNVPPVPAGVARVAVGDNVTVDYIGFFGSGPQTGRVFDTSLKSVALDNTTYPKSLGFTLRNLSGYTPLGVHVGSTPRTGYVVGNLTFVGVVPGFWRGLVGLPVDKPSSISIPYQEGYGPMNLSCLRTRPLVETLSTTVTLTVRAFSTSFPAVAPNAGVTFLDPNFGWTDTILSSNTSAVVVGYMPHVGEVTTHVGWPVVVTAVTASTITLTSELSSGAVGLVGGNLSGNATVCGTHQYIVSSVNPNGTYTENFNREVTGRTLIFRVTILQIVTS